MNIAVFLPNWIGDTVMATPALAALRTLAGHGKLVGVMRPYVGDVLDGLGWFDEQIFYQPKSKNAQLSTRGATGRLRTHRFDLSVSLASSFRTAWMAYRSGASRRVGLARNMSGWLLTDAVKHTKQHSLAVSQIQRFNDLATRAGCPQVEAPLTLATTLADEQAADAVWQQLGLPHGDRVVVINGGSAQGSARSWPVAHFAALAGRIAEEWGLSVLVNCGPAEREAARSIVHLAQSPLVTSLADFELPIGLSKAVIRRSRLLVTTDSGPRFFAVAFARPVVSLFGATPPAMTATGSPLETSLALGLDCQPCLKRVCPLGHQRCMTDLTVERVFAAVRRVVEGLPKVAVA